jgi:MinD superfamily P-loop ATPase
MKQLTIISGKGGTGKTTIASAFAHYAENAVIADSDVDAADLHLILEPEIQEQEAYVGGRTAFIEESQCTQCGTCTEVCRFDAIQDFKVNPISCEGCALCAYVCPEEAIVMKDRISGDWFVSTTREGPMVHAKLGIAEDNSGKLVSMVRQKAREIAEKENNEVIIIDGPPGIGCPVIASITGADMVLVVTEPTLSGLHDMERVIDTAGHFNIPSLVCINKYDINPENTTRIEEWCKERGVDVVGRIPYDKAVTTAMIRKKSVAEYDCGEVSREVNKMWKKVATALAELERKH